MFYEELAVGYILRIRVTPSASKEGITGLISDANGQMFLKISLNAAPENGKANAALIKLLSKTLKISKSSFEIVFGQTDRMKKVLISVSPSQSLLNAIKNLEPKS